MMKAPEACFCEVCKKYFGSKKSLNNHRSLYHREIVAAARKSSVAAYKCEVGDCQSSYSRPYLLNQHVKKVHNELVRLIHFQLKTFCI